MSTDVGPIQTAPEIERVLDALRTRIRRYVLAESVARFLVVAVVLVWLSFAIDWFFEPPRAVRALLLAISGVALAVSFWRLIVDAWLLPLAPRSLALLLERRFPELRDSLITAIEPAAPSLPDEEPYYAEMLAATREAAARRVAALDLDQVFRPAPLVRSVLLAAIAVVSIASLAFARPALFETWTRRALGLSDELYPRSTRLAVEGFEQGYVKVARGADFQVVAQADTKMVVPPTVRIQYETGGVRDRASMDREGNADPARDEFQKYSYNFHVLAPITFDLVGGDDRIEDLRIEVVEVPTVDVGATFLECRFPDYLQRQPRDVPITAAVALPRGTEVVIRAQANKPLVGIDISDGQDLQTSIQPSAETTRFSFPIGRLDESRVVQFTLRDADGIASREPWRLALGVIPDEAPKVSVRLRGIGTAITPQANIPVVGPVEDDYGLTQLWFEQQRGEEQPARRDLAQQPGGQAKLSLEEAVDVRELGLQPGQTFHLQLKARDNCGLDGGANEAASERFTLQVVSPEELRSMLEARELNLRRRFEQLMGEVTETRDALSQLKAEASAPSTDAAPDAADESSPGDAFDARTLVVDRSLQNSRKNADETLSVAVAFDDIHEELINNRVDTEELKIRLQQRIAEPLHKLSAEAFPELDRRLVGLRENVTANSPATVGALAAARGQLDQILVDMQQVLDKMMEMETFNEVVDMLRGIIDTQENLNDETKQQRKQSVRSLLED